MDLTTSLPCSFYPSGNFERSPCTVICWRVGAHPIGVELFEQRFLRSKVEKNGNEAARRCGSGKGFPDVTNTQRLHVVPTWPDRIYSVVPECTSAESVRSAAPRYRQNH